MLGSWSFIFGQYAKYHQESQKFPKCCVPNNAFRKKWLSLFSCQIEEHLSPSETHNAHTQNESLTQLFKPHLLHSYPSHPGERSSIRLKWHTLKYSRRDHPQYAPKVHLSYSLHLCDTYSLYYVLYPSKDLLNYSRGKINHILNTSNGWKRLCHTKCQIS